MEENKSFDEFVAKLDTLFESNNPTETENGTEYFCQDTNNLAYELSGDATELLIENGSVNQYMCKNLGARGYIVYAVERDSFGWLTGGIRKCGQNKVLTFG